MKKAKSILTVAALAMGLGVGFGVAFTPAQAQAQGQQGLVECSKDSHCDARCGAQGAGACVSGRCACKF